MTDETQRDDHCWLVVAGHSWKIRRISGSAVYVWRGYEPHVEYGVVDMGMVDMDRYCETAASMLAASA